MRPHFLGAAHGRPALPVLRRLLSTLLAAAVAMVGLVAVSATAAPGARAAAEAAAAPTVTALVRPSVYNDPPKVGELAFAHPGTWSPQPDSVTFTWYRSGSPTPIGTGNPVWIPFEALGETLRVTVTAKKAGYADGTSTSLASKAVVPGPPTNYAKPAVYGEAAIGNTVAAWPGVWSVEPDSYAYRWFQEGKAAPVGTTEQLVVPADAAGKKLTVEVTVKKTGYEDGVATSDPVTAYDASSQPVVNDVKPKISANPAVGSLAVVHPGVWTPEPDSVTAQWFQSGSAEPIGTGLTIVVPASALGKTLTAKVTAKKSGRVDGVAVSDPSAPVASGTLANGEKPAIFGSPVVGSTVEAWEGTWSAAPDSYTYRWLVAGSAQPVGTGKQLVVPAGAAGKQLSVEVTAKKSAYADGVATSPAVTVQASAPAPVQNTTAPAISGELVVGGSATATTGTWSPTPDSTQVTWFRSGSATPIGTGATLASIPAEAEGETLQVVVVAKKAGSSDGIAYSAPRGPVAPAGSAGEVRNLAPPQITADPRVGEPAGVHPGVWDPADVDVTLTWFRSGSTEPIGTGTVIVVPAAAAGQTLTVKATATKTGYESGTATSAPSEQVAKGTLAPKPGAGPVVYGEPVAGASVEAWEGLWPAAPDSFSYRWFLSGSDTPVATTKKLTIPADAVGKELTVEVTAKKAGYDDGVATSEPVTVEPAGTAEIENVAPPEIVVDPEIGQPRVGDLVGVQLGGWNPWPDDYEIQWFREGSATPIGDTNVIVVPASAVGKALTVKVTVKKDGYADGQATSAPSAPVAEGELTVQTAPTINGYPAPGATVAAAEGWWSAVPDSYGYRWFQEGKATPIGTGRQLTIPADAAGKKLTVEVTAKKAGYADGVAVSAPVTVLTAAQGPACGAATTSLSTASAVQAAAAADVSAARSKVATLKAKKKLAKKQGKTAKVARLKVRIRNAKAALADANADLATANANLAAAQALATASCS
ncbi:hypothetical protein ACJ5H2_05435 [Nocardioides sp. R1-1]|uniref:hypothetical protein n=1 Tax=Nocardioides sp. R1-1 TaxID=3383502 RepID=UPI0038D250E6